MGGSSLIGSMVAAIEKSFTNDTMGLVFALKDLGYGARRVGARVRELHGREAARANP
jgi:hypothetical protein